MAITVYPLNNIDYTAEDVGIYNATRTSGIYANDDFALSLTGSDNIISVDVGLAWMHLSRFFGVAVALKNKTFVDMGLPDSVYSRIDALVLQFDANKNGADVVVKSGTASSNPHPPALSQTEALYELHLAHVLRKPGAASIAAADVTDMRLSTKYCGIMSDPVSKVDTAAIDAQISALIEKLKKDLADVENQDYYASKNYVQEEVRKAAPFNYADNSDFTQFVAQAGIGGKHGNQAYAGDRWILDSGTVTGEANANGNGYTNITLNGTIRQIVANPPDVGTAAIEMVSGTATAVYGNGTVTITSSGGVIKNVQLFKGAYTADNMPNYQPKGYGVELTECQRYFQKNGALSTSIQCWNAAADGASFSIPLTVSMRIFPTCDFVSAAILDNSGTSRTIKSYEVMSYTDSDASIRVRVASDKAWVRGGGGVWIGAVTLNADL